MDGTIERINRRAVETFGYLPDDIPDMERWWAQAYPDASYREEVITQWMGLVEKALAEKSDIERREYRVTCKDGTVKTTLIFGIPVADRIFVMFDDISERKRWEESLTESEFFFKESQRAAFIGSYKADFKTGIWQSSEVLDRIFGIDECYARTIQGWVEIIHPGDRKKMARYLREEVLSKHCPFNREYRIVRKSDGEQRWVHGLGEVCCDSAGNVIFLIGTIQDITERKMADDALKMNEDRIQSLLKLHQIKFNTEKEIVDFALEEVVRLTRSTGGYLHFFNEDEQTIQLYSWSEEVMKTCVAVQGQHYPLDSAGIWADSARTKGPVLHNDYQSIAGRQGYPEGHFHVSRHLGVPILVGDRVVGVTGVGNKELPYNESDVLQVRLYMNSMWSILHQKRMDIERGKMEEKLLHAATYDPLTGVLNRQALEKICQAELERARRYDTSFSLIMLDVDDFKRINDTLGHQAGDRVLVRIGEALRQNVRSVDSVGRWGGEEFIVELPETNGREAAYVAEKLRDTIANLRVDGLDITASFGVASFRNDDTLDTMIKRVDDLLYRAKDRGKNRVET
jgi:diguanylate cyclase (GGDEF)-like protein/PAS domain S-box-containing protein